MYPGLFQAPSSEIKFLGDVNETTFAECIRYILEFIDHSTPYALHAGYNMRTSIYGSGENSFLSLGFVAKRILGKR